VDVEHHGSRRRCHNAWTGAGPWGMRGPWGMGFRRGGGGGCGWRGRGGWGNGFSFGQWGGYPAAPQQQPGAPQQQPGAEKSTSMDQDPPKESQRSETGPGTSMSPPREQDWTFVQPSASSSGTDVEGAARAVENLHVTGQMPSTAATDLTPSSDTNHAIIQESVERMMSMGYSNEGGWLTALLGVYKGDINAALDAIKQQK